MKIFVYDLVSLVVKEVEVDRIEGGRAIQSRMEGSKAPKTFTKFSLTEQDAINKLRKFLHEEIFKRKARMDKLIKVYNSLTEDYSKRVSLTPNQNFYVE